MTGMTTPGERARVKTGGTPRRTPGAAAAGSGSLSGAGHGCLRPPVRRDGEKALPVLQAAHIRPVTKEGPHRVDNGLLLRADIHALFDQGYVTVTPEHRFLVSRRLKTDFDNGEPYLSFSGKRIWLPGRDEDQPSREFLEWHADAVYRG